MLQYGLCLKRCVLFSDGARSVLILCFCLCWRRGGLVLLHFYLREKCIYSLSEVNDDMTMAYTPPLMLL